jgi:hypothetical protein
MGSRSQRSQEETDLTNRTIRRPFFRDLVIIAQFPRCVGCKKLAYDQFKAVDIDKNWIEWMGGDAVEVKKLQNLLPSRQDLYKSLPSIYGCFEIKEWVIAEAILQSQHRARLVGN